MCLTFDSIGAERDADPRDELTRYTFGGASSTWASGVRVDDENVTWSLVMPVIMAILSSFAIIVYVLVNEKVNFRVCSLNVQVNADAPRAWTCVCISEASVAPVYMRLVKTTSCAADPDCWNCRLLSGIDSGTVRKLCGSCTLFREIRLHSMGRERCHTGVAFDSC